MAFNVISTVNLDMSRPNAIIVNAVQYDSSGRVVRANLYNNGEQWAVPSDCYPVIRYQKSDRIGGFYDIDENNTYAISYLNNRTTVDITLALQMLTTVGNVNAQINFYNTSGQRVTSFAFKVKVQASAINDETIVSSEYYNALTIALQKAVQVGNITELTTKAESAANRASAYASQAATAASTAAQEVIETVPQEVSDWLTQHITNPTNPPIDTSLSVAGSAADAKATGDAINYVKNSLSRENIENTIRGNTRLRIWNSNSGWSINNTRLSCTTPIYYPFDVYIDANDVTENMAILQLLYFNAYYAGVSSFVSSENYNIGKNGRNIVKIPANTYCCFSLSRTNNAAFDSADLENLVNKIKISFIPFIDDALSIAGAAADAKEVGRIINSLDSDALSSLVASMCELKAWNDTYGFVTNKTRLSLTKPIKLPFPVWLDVNSVSDYVTLCRVYLFSSTSLVGNVISYTDYQVRGNLIPNTYKRQMVKLPANTYWCFMLAQLSNMEFDSISLAQNIKLSFSPFIDTTLETDNSAADSKATSEQMKLVAGNNYDSLPAYYHANNYIENKYKTIIANSRVTSGITFPFITDVHLGVNKKKSAYLLREVMKNCGLPFTIFGGDVNTAYSKVYGNELQEAYDDANAWLQYCGIIGNERMYKVRGNHDFSKSSASGAGSPTKYVSIPNKDAYSYIARFQDRTIPTLSPWNYYCIDNPSQKIRIFVLDEYSTSGAGQSTQNVFNRSQYYWIFENIRNVHGYSFIFISHQPFDIQIGTNNYDSVYAPIFDLFKAMKNKRVFSYQNTSLNINTTYDFSDFDNEFVCHICGHTHKDLSAVSENVLTITTGCDAFYVNDDPPTNRVDNSITEQLFDVFSIDTTAKTIKACRIGGGSDRSWTY